MNKYAFKTRPYKHQLDALRKLLQDPARQVGGGLPMDMGTGKTKVVIDYAAIKHQLGEIDRVLVCAPLSALGVWDREVIKHQPDDCDLRWKSVNYDKLVRKHYTISRGPARGTEVHVDHVTPLIRWVLEGKCLLVLDESHEIKNPQSKQSKMVYEISKHCARTIWMTGTPTGGNPMDLFAQMRTVDEGILGGSWGVFKRTYGIWGGFGGFQLIKYMNLPQLQQRVEPYTFPMKLDDCMDMPGFQDEVIPVRLEESRKTYDRLANEAIVEFEGVEVVTPHVFARMTRLSQLTGGWLVGDEHRRRVGKEKERAFADHVQQMRENEVQKAVVFANWLDDLRTTVRVCRAAGYHVVPFWGGLDRDKRDRFIAHFDETEKPTVFCSQIRAGSQSISLAASHYTLYYGHTFSLIKYLQSRSRTYRIGQRQKVTYYHFLCEDTIDEAIWLALRTKRKVAELILRHPELIK